MSQASGASPPDMGPRFVRGVLYVGAGSWVASALNFAVAIVVARLLGPEAFGVYALAIAWNELVNIVMGFGIAPALVQSPEESDQLFDTGYAMSFALGLLGLLIAGGIAWVLWDRPDEVALFLLLLAGARIALLLSDVALARLDRRLRYGPIAVIDFSAKVLPNLGCVALAWGGFGAFSLVVRDLGMAGLAFALSHLWSRYRFGGRVEGESFRRILSFSGPMFVGRTLDVFLARFDRLLVGSFLGNAAIGIYHQARFLTEAGLLATVPVMKVTFNLYSRVQDDAQRLARSYSLVNTFLVRLLFAGSATLLVFPRETVLLLLGEEWLDLAPLLRVLALYAGLMPLVENLKVLLYARAAMAAAVRIRLFQVAVFTPAALLAVVWLESPVGAAWALLSATALGLGLASWAVRDVVGAAFSRIYATPALALAASSALCWGLLGPALGGAPYWLLPFVPPLVFWAAVALVERGSLLREVGYLRAQLGRRGP